MYLADKSGSKVRSSPTLPFSTFPPGEGSLKRRALILSLQMTSAVMCVRWVSYLCLMDNGCPVSSGLLGASVRPGWSLVRLWLLFCDRSQRFSLVTDSHPPQGSPGCRGSGLAPKSPPPNLSTRAGTYELGHCFCKAHEAFSFLFPTALLPTSSPGGEELFSGAETPSWSAGA